MKLLALDTSSNACSVAVQVGSRLFEKHVVEPREHTKILVPMIEQLLQDADTKMSALDAIVLGNGPGSFIGMRIGASVAQGLCHGAGLEIVPVSSLAAVAAEVICDFDADNVIVAQDARMHEIYVGHYRSDADGLPKVVGDEGISGIDSLDIPGEQMVVAGSAWEKFPQMLLRNNDRISKVVEVSVPRARHLLGLGARRYKQGRAIAPEKLVPAYIRMKVAEIPAALT